MPEGAEQLEFPSFQRKEEEKRFESKKEDLAENEARKEKEIFHYPIVAKLLSGNTEITIDEIVPAANKRQAEKRARLLMENKGKIVDIEVKRGMNEIQWEALQARIKRLKKASQDDD